MPKSERNKFAFFIDGSNLHSSAKALGVVIDFKKLLKLFNNDGELLRAYYYTAISENQDHSSIRSLVDWLAYNGYTLKTKPTKEFIDSDGRKKLKGDMDIELAIDALEIAPHIDHAIIFSGDGDFRYLVEVIQRKGVRVTVVSTLKSVPAMIADELRRQADDFVELEDILDNISLNVENTNTQNFSDEIINNNITNSTSPPSKASFSKKSQQPDNAEDAK